MLNETQLSQLKDKYPETDKLVEAVNVGSHNEAIKQAQGVVEDNAVNGKIDANLASEELLALLLSQVSEEIIIDDPGCESMTVADWIRSYGKANPRDKGWTLVDDRLYRPRAQPTTQHIH